MLAIPLPFVVSLLLLVIAILLLPKHPTEGKAPFLFIILCAVSTAVVGLRWTFDVAIFRFIQPIFASLLPVTAWYCFAKAHRSERFSPLHWVGPIVITACSFGYQIWLEAIDIILTALYLGYGALLIRSSFVMPEEVRLSNIERVALAERVAGVMLLVSACIDGALSFDFLLYEGEHTTYILSLSYLLLIPAVVATVLIAGISTFRAEAEASQDSQPNAPTDDTIASPSKSAKLTEQDAQYIVRKIDTLMQQKEAFRDPNLTLGHLSRKITIPARQVSMAVNQVHGQNISKMLNEYRITHAKRLLITSEESVTEIYLSSGFQSKSNFNREFARITGQTPSAYRRDASAPCEK